MVTTTLSRARPGDFVELTKPGIVALVMLTVAAGFWLAGPALQQTLVLFHALLGTALTAAGTNALNQVAERDVDAAMLRTRNRPVPTGRLSVPSAAAFAWLCGISGVLYLAVFVNTLTAALAAVTLILYVFLYTPLKRKTEIATLIGAVPGAIPIVGGWTAGGGDLGLHAGVLFSILFLWQLPHFLALEWMYREDYARAGIKALTLTDPKGGATFRQATLYAAALLPISLAPTVLGIAGAIYFVGAVVLSGWFLLTSVSAVRNRTDASAVRLFRASLVYLPVLLLMMVSNRVL